MNNTQYAKQELRNFISKIDKKLEAYWDSELDQKFGINQKQKNLVREMISHSKEHNLRPAKRLRGAFTYFAYMLGSKSVNENIWKACISLELVQTALLMHDDFMDQDLVRRGQPTSQIFFGKNGDKHYGDAMAVTVGDAVLCHGFQLLNDCEFEPARVVKASQKMLRGIAETAYGQAYDVTLEKLINEWEEDDVISLHKAKTSIYTYENPLFIGGYLAGLPEAAFPILREYSINGGVAFQLQDDILGIFGDTEKTGKSANSDLLQGKCTLLVMRVLSHGNKEQKDAIKKVWGDRVASPMDIDLAKNAIVSSGSLEYSKNISRDFAKKAITQAKLLRGLNLNTEAINFLEGIAEYMIEREL